MLGYSEKDLLNFTFKDITFKDDISKDLDEMEKLNRGEILNYTREKRYVGKDGKIIWGNLSTNAVRDSTGKIIYYMPRISSENNTS